MLKSAIARLGTAPGNVLGAGFLLAPDLIATCAHVVAPALGATPEQRDVPTGSVHIEFPLLNPTAGCRGEVANWYPLRPDGTGDIAILRIVDPVPAGALPAPIRLTSEVGGHPFRTIGFPEDQTDGIWVEGRLLGAQGTGWIQMETVGSQWSIERGFSGAPVWDTATEGVVGMVVTSARRNDTTAHLIPVAILGDVWATASVNPFRGLTPFREQDAALFHGREADVDALAGQFRNKDLLAVAGPSGCGKTSLIRAGLLPRLRSGETTIIDVRPDTGSDPIHVLADALGAVLFADLDPDERRRSVLRHAENPDELVPDLVAATGGAGAVLFLDQFEELVVGNPAAARDCLELITRLTSVARPEPGRAAPLRAILTLRSRSLDDLITRHTAAELNDAVRFLEPMSRDQLGAAITEPAETVGGLAFESGLVERILDDTADEPAPLPLLALVLEQLWERRHGGWLTHASYERLSGVSGALRQRADDVVDALRPGQRDRARRLLTQLTWPDGEGGFARRPTRLAELGSDLHEAAQHLARHRLIVLSPLPDGDQRVELVHQALIDHWSRLRDWLAEDDKFLTWQANLRYQIDRWERTGQDSGGLLRGAELAEAADWLRERYAEVPGSQRSYIEHSIRAERGRTQRWRIITAIAVTLMLISSVLTASVIHSRQTVRDQLRAASARLLAQQSAQVADQDPGAARQLALAAWSERPGSPDAYEALLKQYLQWRSVDQVAAPEAGGDLGKHTELWGGPGPFTITAAQRLSGLTVWKGTDMTTPWRHIPIHLYTGVTVSPDWRTAAVSHDLGGVTLIDLETGVRHELRPSDPPGAYRPSQLTPEMRFSADGQFLMTVFSKAYDDDRAHPPQLWDVRKHREIRTLGSAPVPGRTVEDGTPMPGGRTALLTESDDARTHLVLRDLTTGNAIRSFPALSIPVRNGTTVAVCEGERLRAFDTVSGKQRWETTQRECPTDTDRTDRYLVGEANPGNTDAPQQRVFIRGLDGRQFSAEFPGIQADLFSTSVVVTPAPGDAVTVTALSSGTRHRSVVGARDDQTPGEPPVTESTVLAPGPGWVVGFDDEGGTGDIILSETTGDVLARIPRSGSEGDTPALGFSSDHKVLFEVGANGLTAYRTPDLRELFHTRLPVPEELRGYQPKSDQLTGWQTTLDMISEHEIIVCHAGLLSRWDLRTGQRIGDPVALSRTATGTAIAASLAQAQALPGEPGRFLVTGFEGTQVRTAGKSAPDERISFDIGTNPKVEVHPSGRWLIATSSSQSDIRVWDRVERRMLPSFGSAETYDPIGFAGDLFVTNASYPDADRDGVEIWDWRNGRRLAMVDLPGFGSDDQFVRGDSILSYDADRAAVVEVPLEPHRWFRELCRSGDREFTRAETRSLPEGATRDRPCAAS